MADIVIETIDDLEKFINGELGTGDSSNLLNVVLANDLDFSELDDDDERKWNFRYTGTPPTLFMNFNGGGHSIKNLAYGLTANNWSLFGTVGGSIANLTLSDMSISSARCVGLIRGTTSSKPLSLSNCHTRGYLQGTVCAGLADESTSSPRTLTMDRCSVSGTLIGQTVYGLAGGYGGSSTRCYVTADIRVTNNGSAGLFTMDSRSGPHTNCFFRGNVYTSSTGVGSVVFSSDNTDQYCYTMIHNATSLPSKYNIFGSGANACFYNNDEYDYGTSTIASKGTDKANLQNAEWLRAQGWPI